jgi:hypothetical protein
MLLEHLEFGCSRYAIHDMFDIRFRMHTSKLLRLRLCLNHMVKKRGCTSPFQRPALCTVAVNFQLVPGNLKIVGLADVRFRRLHTAVPELDDLAAAQTAQVAVVLMAVNVLVVHVSVLEKDFLHQAAFHQQGQGAVYRSPGDAQAFMTQAQNKLFHIKVVMIGKNLRQDRLSFRRGSHALLGQKFLEDFPFGFHVIAIETLSQ